MAICVELKVHGFIGALGREVLFVKVAVVVLLGLSRELELGGVF